MKFYDEVNEPRATLGFHSQLNYYNETLKKYCLAIPTESLPAVAGDINTVDVDLLTSSIVSKIEGKTTLNDVDVEYLAHRDNDRRIKKLFLNKSVKYLISCPDGTGTKFTAKAKMKRNDINSSDKLLGTMTLIPSEITEEPLDDVRELMARTCTITSVIPESIDISTSNTAGITVILSSGVEGATFTATSNLSTITTSVTKSSSDGTSTLTIKPSSATAGSYAIVEVTASADGCQSWSSTIAINVIA